MDSLVTGTRHAIRRLMRAPFFTAITIVTLAIGIGANTAIFSVVYGVLLKPLPFAQPDRLVGVWHRAPGLDMPLLNQSPATYLTYREEGRVWDDIGMWQNGAASITGVGEPERVQVLNVTDGTLPLLGVHPALGRGLTGEDDQPGSPLRVLFTHGYWQRRFGGDPAVVGRTIVVDGNHAEVIGVLPASFRFLRTSPDIVMPMRLDRSEVFVGNFSYRAVARLKPGVTIEQANADVARLLPTVPDRFPMPPGFTREMYQQIGLAPNVRPLEEDVIGDTRNVLWVLFGTVGIVLLIACANVANLFLVRSEGRQQELALRAALGASRGRLARSLLGESIGLALAGGLVGLLFAYGAIRLLVRLAPAGLPRREEIALDPIVLLFALAVSIVAGVLFGLIPVLRFGTPSMAALKEGGRASSDGPSRNRTRNALVVAEIALALVLLIVSGLMLRTFVALRQVEPGFVRPEEVQTFRISIPEMLVKDPVQVVRTHEQIAAALARVPGVTSVGLGSSITMDGFDSNDPIFARDVTPEDGSLPPIRRYKWLGPGYVETLGNRVTAGRTIDWNDIYQQAPVVMVSDGLARELWGSPAAALGKQVRNAPGSPWREVVGVVADERDDGLNQPAPKIVYWPMMIKEFWDEAIHVRRTMAYAVRSQRMGSPSFMKELQTAVWSVNPNLPLASVATLDQVRADSMAKTSFALVMLGIAGAVALLLGVVGIYGVIAYIVAQRTREIGIRMALGAQMSDVSRLFLRHGVTLAAIGIAIGLVAALLLTRLMASLLFGVSAVDPVTYIATALALGGTAVLATYVPARRAAKTDPLVALRVDG